MSQESSVAILMGTYNGERFLGEQLQSFAAQTHARWQLWASDDNSTDGTRAVLEAFRRAQGDDRVFILNGPKRGFAANFLSLACNPRIDADYYAFSDQDDIWEPEKLARGVARLSALPPGVPGLYGTRTKLIDAEGRDIGISPLFTRPPAFPNALVQSIAGGNTMVFNRAARDLLRAAGDRIAIAVHDWWIYQVVSGCGGTVIYDPEPSMRYRHHGNNQIGPNTSLPMRLLRMRLLMGGRLKGWTDLNTAALQTIRDRLTPESRRILDEFCAARGAWLIPRLIGMRKTGIYRQTPLGTVAVWAAAVVNRL